MQSLHFVCLVLAIFFSVLGTILFIVSVTTNNWDKIEFNFSAINTSVTKVKGVYIAPAETLVDTNKEIVGLILHRANNTGYCILNLYGGMWNLCDKVDITAPVNSRYSICKKYDKIKGNNSCFDYINGYMALRSAEVLDDNVSEAQIMKMQNNTIACCIVVLLCLGASIFTSIIGVLARLVPSIMVTGVLYLTAGIFVIFSNSIEHEKVSRMMKKPLISSCSSCVCYSLLNTPDEACTSSVRTVSTGWSLAVSWVAGFLYLFGCCCWLYIARQARIEKSKIMM